MLKKRELHESAELFELMTHPEVFPYVRQKAHSAEEFAFMTRQLMVEEHFGKTVSRTITDDWGKPIGVIALFDVADGAGFLGTWIGKPYQGKGYNQKAKVEFFKELFFELGFQTVFMKVRKVNKQSQRAVEKLGYTIDAKELHPALYAQVNSGDIPFELFKVDKDNFYLYLATQTNEEEQAI